MLYFSQNVNKEVKEIYLQTFFANLALALVFIFEPIYLYTLSHSLNYILWFYVEVYACYALLVCLGARFAGKFGYKHSITVSNFFYVGYWILLYCIQANPMLYYIAPIFFALQKSFYWPAYNADVALFDVKSQRGREIGVLFSSQEIAFILAPFIGGLILAKFGFLPLFVLASIIMLASAIPLFYSRDVFTKHQFRFKNLWQVLHNHKQNFLGYFGFAEDLMVMTLWPVYIFLVIPNFSKVGTITAIAMLISAVLMLYVGRQSDDGNKRFLIERNSIIYGLSWLFRFAAKSLPWVLIFDILTKTLKSLVMVPMTALTFEAAGSKRADYAIAYSVFFEFSLSIAKIFTALMANWILSSTGNIFVVFGFVGILTMFYGLLKK